MILEVAAPSRDQRQEHLLFWTKALDERRGRDTGLTRDISERQAHRSHSCHDAVCRAQNRTIAGRPAAGRAFVESWIWPHILTAWHASKLMVDNQSGLIVEVVEQDNVEFHGAFYVDLMETLLKRLVFALAHELGKHGVTAVAVNPGFMRTEAILDGFGVTDANWRDALKSPEAAGMGWGGSESTCFVGRAVAALAADPNVGRKNGGIYTTRSLSQEYGFADVDGARPDYAVFDAAFEVAKTTFLAPMTEAARFAKVEWKLTPKAERPMPGPGINAR